MRLRSSSPAWQGVLTSPRAPRRWHTATGSSGTSCHRARIRPTDAQAQVRGGGGGGRSRIAIFLSNYLC